MDPTEPHPAEPGAEAYEDRSGPRRAALLSAALVAVLGGLLGALFALAPGGADGEPSAPAISAADWVGDAAATDPEEGPRESERAAATVDRSEAPERRYEPPPPEPAGGTPGGGTSEGASERAQTVKRGEVRSGVPVIKSLTGIGISAGDAQLLINALDGIFDFRRARPGQAFELRLDADTGEPTYFRYEESLVDIYEVRLVGKEYRGRKKRVPTTRRTVLFGGTVSSSLYKALADAGAHPSLSGKIVEVLSTLVDFYKAQRPGDTFRVMVEEETLGESFLGYGPVLALEYDGVKSGKKRFFRFEAGGGRATYYDQKGISVPSSEISIPLHYTRISSPFGMRYHPVLKRRKMHNGVDFSAPPGTPVWACREGKVIIADYRGANGNLVAIDHGEGLLSYYAHLSRFAAGVRVGVEVRERQVIGYVGSTGRSTGPHLHFGLKVRGRFADPLKYKIRPGRPVSQRHRAALQAIISERGGKLDATRIRPASEPLAEDPGEAGTDVMGLEEDI